MRDDIQNHFTSINSSLHRKLRLLRDLLEKEREILYSLKTENTDRAADLIESDDALIEEINTLDALVAEKRRLICAAAGIDYSGFHSFFKDIEEEAACEMRRLEESMQPVLKELMEMRITVGDMLAGALGRTGKDIEELERIDRLRNIQIGSDVHFKDR